MFYDVIQSLCDEKGISMSKLALDLKISKSNITNWKNGSSPRLDKIKKIAAYFGVSADCFIEQKNKPATQSDELNKLLKDPEMKEIYDVLTLLSQESVGKVLEYARFQREQEKKQNS